MVDEVYQGLGSIVSPEQISGSIWNPYILGFRWVFSFTNKKDVYKLLNQIPYHIGSKLHTLELKDKH